MYVIAQIIGIIAMVFNISSYQFKEQKRVIACQLIGSGLFSIHFFMLGAYIGGLLNAIALVRAIVFLRKDIFKTERIEWLIGFIVVYVLSYVLTFTVFGKEFNVLNAFIEVLPVVGMTAMTIAFRSKSTKVTRLAGLVSSPSWLVYNIVNFAIGAICCEVFSLISIIVGLIRIDGGKRRQKNGRRSAKQLTVWEKRIRFCVGNV